MLLMFHSLLIRTKIILVASVLVSGIQSFLLPEHVLNLFPSPCFRVHGPIETLSSVHSCFSGVSVPSLRYCLQPARIIQFSRLSGSLLLLDKEQSLSMFWLLFMVLGLALLSVLWLSGNHLPLLGQCYLSSFSRDDVNATFLGMLTRQIDTPDPQILINLPDIDLSTQWIP